MVEIIIKVKLNPNLDRFNQCRYSNDKKSIKRKIPTKTYKICETCLNAVFSILFLVTKIRLGYFKFLRKEKLLKFPKSEKPKKQKLQKQKSISSQIVV